MMSTDSELINIIRPGEDRWLSIVYLFSVICQLLSVQDLRSNTRIFYLNES